jgi:hypothetical protein
MGNCIYLVRNIDDYPPDIYNKILLSFSYNLNINYKNTLYVDELYNWDGIPLVRINKEFISNCIRHSKIVYPYYIIHQNGLFKITFNTELIESMTVYKDSIDTIFNNELNYRIFN